MKALRHIALYLAGVIILAHNLVPHQHHQENKNEKHCLIENTLHEHGLLAWLGDLFHHNPGADHLEDLRKTESNPNLSFWPLAMAQLAAPHFPPQQLSTTALYHCPENQALPDYLVISLRKLRGPPALC